MRTKHVILFAVLSFMASAIIGAAFTMIGGDMWLVTNSTWALCVWGGYFTTA